MSNQEDEKRLFVVSIETAVMVYADNARSAERLAEDAMRDLSPYDYDVFASVFCKGHALPGDWDEAAIPYGEEGDRTIGQILDAKQKKESEK
jgi:hypothetical protein